jgi:hypothetical protein
VSLGRLHAATARAGGGRLFRGVLDDVGTGRRRRLVSEVPGLVGDVGEEPGSRGNVHTARWTDQLYASDLHATQMQARCWRIDIPFRMDATRMWDTVKVGRALSHGAIGSNRALHAAVS